MEIKRQEVKRRERIFRGDRKEVKVKDKIVVLVDDGAATGATLKAAIKEVWAKNPKRIIVALPLSSKELKSELEKIVDVAVVLEVPEPFFAVGQGYEEFKQVSDEEVIRELKKGNKNGEKD